MTEATRIDLVTAGGRFHAKPPGWSACAHRVGRHCRRRCWTILSSVDRLILFLASPLPNF